MNPIEATWQSGLLLIVALFAIAAVAGWSWAYAEDAIRAAWRKARAAINRLRS